MLLENHASKYKNNGVDKLDSERFCIRVNLCQLTIGRS